MKKTVKPRIKRRIRGLAGRRIVFESFGPRAPSYVAIIGCNDPSAAWITAAELRRFVAAARSALR